MAIVLIVKSEDGIIEELPILRKMTLGRSATCDFRIVDTKISGVHCTFELTPKGELLFSDLDSTNGSYLNNSKVHRVYVKINDVIRVGNTLIKIDEKKLSPGERQSIGVSSISSSGDKELSLNDGAIPSMKLTNEEILKKRAISLGKNIKQKKANPGQWQGVDNVIEQEESSGHTKFLKLDKVKTQKKK